MNTQIIRYRIRSTSHNFSLSIEEHGAYSEGAENVIFRPNRPLNDHDILFSTNGRAFFADNGNLLFLKDAALFVVVRMSDERVFHMEPPSPWLFGRVWIEDDHIHADLYQFDNLDLEDKVDPIPLSEITDRLDEGWGKSADGLFPTANSNFVNFYNRHK